MVDCDKDCERCTHAACMVDEYEYQIQKAGLRKPKKKDSKRIITWSPSERNRFEQEYVRTPNSYYDF